MICDFCDRCGEETTGVQSGAINGIEDADRDGHGTVTQSFDILCTPCYAAAIAFIETPPAEPASAALVPDSAPDARD